MQKGHVGTAQFLLPTECRLAYSNILEAPDKYSVLVGEKP